MHKDTDLSYQFPQQLPIMFLITPGYSEQEIPAPIVEFISAAIMKLQFYLNVQ